MAELNKLSIKDAADGLKEKKFSAVDLLNDCLTEIAEKDGELNSFVTLDEEGAMKSAELSDKKRAEGEDLSLLSGIPVAIKDIYCVKGLRNTCGSPIMRDFVAPYDATVVEKFKNEGMVILGKTNTDEFACGISTETSYSGVTKNPVDLKRVAGGSSGGSAAALAADLTIAAVGTDTGGSIRQPASFCGVYGLKVTYGRVSRSGITSMASSWDSIGPFGKTPEDLAFMMNSMAGKDRRDLTSSDRDVPDYTKFSDIKGMKIGLPKEYFSDDIEKEVKDRIMESVGKLEARGAEVHEIELPMTKYAVASYYITMPAELSANLERFDGIRYGKKPEAEVEDMVDYYFKARGEGFGDEIKRRIMIGTYALSAGYYDAYYKKSQKIRTLIVEDFTRAFEEVDVIVGPVVPFPAYEIGKFTDDPLKMYLADALTIPASAAGVPALSCPVGESSEGLPIGLQVIAPQFEENRCLNIGNALHFC